MKWPVPCAKARSSAASATRPATGLSSTTSARLRVKAPGSSMIVASANPKLTRITPPTPAPIRAEPSISASRTPLQRHRQRCASTARGGVQRAGDRRQRQHGQRRLEIVADPVEARAQDRVGPEQRAHQQLRARERVGAERDDRRERRARAARAASRTSASVSAPSAGRAARSSRTRPRRSARAPPAAAPRRAPTARRARRRAAPTPAPASTARPAPRAAPTRQAAKPARAGGAGRSRADAPSAPAGSLNAARRR